MNVTRRSFFGVVINSAAVSAFFGSAARKIASKRKNAILTPDLIAREALEQLKNNNGVQFWTREDVARLNRFNRSKGA